MAQYHWGLASVILSVLIYCCTDLNFYYDKINFVPPFDDSHGNTITVNSDKRLYRKTFCISEETCTIHAWLYYKDNSSNELPPLSIIISGLGTLKEISGVPWAEALAIGRVAVLVFDYRHWGRSKGLPRQHIDISHQLQDIASVLEFTQSSKELQTLVDTKSIHLIGQSLGAGHTVKTLQSFAAINPALKNHVKSGILLVPFLSGKESLKNALSSRPLLLTIRTTLTVLFESIRTWILHLPPIYIKIASRANESEVSAMQLSETDYNLWHGRIQRFAKTPESWSNRITVQSLHQISRYEPLTTDVNIKQPILIIAGENDNICPYDVIQRRVQAMSNSTSVNLLSMPITHFEILKKENMEWIVGEMNTFIEKYI